MSRAPGKDIAEIFGHAPDDLSECARSLWTLKACPFINRPCIKTNHDKSIVYGVCSVENLNGDEIITCPNRMYANEYGTLRVVSEATFGPDTPFLTYDQYVRERGRAGPLVVALGKNSGREVTLGKQLSIDWVLAYIDKNTLLDYAGVEIQTMDITGNYRNCWAAYDTLPQTPKRKIPSSNHGINWANVHKRLIPQLIRKGSVFRKSTLCTKGLHFALPELVYQRFEKVVGDLDSVDDLAADVLTVYTFAIGPNVEHGQIRPLTQIRTERFTLKAFAEGFISGPYLPTGQDLDDAVRRVLGIR